MPLAEITLGCGGRWQTFSTTNIRDQRAERGSEAPAPVIHEQIFLQA